MGTLVILHDHELASRITRRSDFRLHGVSVAVAIVLTAGLPPRKDDIMRVARVTALASRASIDSSIVEAMAMTSMQIDSKVRDELARVAEGDLGGVSLGEAVRQLIMEHHIAHINRRYEELRADPEEWASYTAEARLTDNVAGEGLPSARDEYPELNQ